METIEQYISLSDFLAALRFEGIPIGPQELIRLQHVFSLAPTLSRPRLKALLACTLIKYETHHERFEALFESWCPPEDIASEPSPKLSETPAVVQPTIEPDIHETSATAIWPIPEQAPLPKDPRNKTATTAAEPLSEQLPSPKGPTEFLPSWRLQVVVLLILILGGLGYYTFKGLGNGGEPPTPRPPTVSVTSPTQAAPTTLPSQPVEQFWTWVPTFDVPKPPLINPMWTALTFALLGLFSGVFLWWRYDQRHVFPAAEASPAPGPTWLPLQAPEAAGPELLDREELRAAVWSVERFVSEDETRAMDVDDTVTATAKAGGLPTMRFQRAVYTREVWLWRDVMVQDVTLDHLLHELETSLTRAGLPVRVGTFADTPALIRWHEGQEFSPLTLEGYRQSALVLMFTDGYGMQLAQQSALESSLLTTLLHAFGEWPRLTFVDCSAGAYSLTTLVQAYDLRCIAPEDVPAFLSASPVQSVTRRHADPALHGDLGAWAAATALAPEPVTIDSAFELRQHLGLSLASWELRDLLMAAESDGERLTWSPSQRAELLNWLAQCSQDNGTVASESSLARALDYWLARSCDTDTQRQDHQSPLLPWQHTLAEQRLRLEVALLTLWRQPIEATKTLYSLRNNLGADIRERLAWLADWSGRQQQRRNVVYLPWSMDALPTAVRWMLAELGFATGQAGILRQPVKFLLALGLCAGLALASVGAIGWQLLTPSTPVLTPRLPEAFQGVMIQDVQPSGLGMYRIALGTPKALQVATAVPAHSVIDVQWQWQPQKNVETFGGSELWRAGTLPQAIRGCEAGWPRRSLVVIQAEPTDTPARQLAIQLLDRGNADAVLLGMDWTEHVDKLIQVDAGMTSAGQLLLILPPDTSVRAPVFQGNHGIVTTTNLQNLVTRLDFSGVRPVQEVWGEIKGSPEANVRLLLRGGPEEKRDDRTGVTFVTVCGGTFTMGSADDDKLADDDEKPSHPVTLSPFEISKTEMTNKQYRSFQQDRQGDDNLPVVGISWKEAKAFSEHFDYVLPTEAEWEYAARGGTVTPWSFGDDAEKLGDYAWNDSQIHPVGEKLPNPLGLYDMHGNVYEWAEDCYDEKAYRDRSPLIVNPAVGGSCSWRVLRGGAYWRGAGDLRSALRFRHQPVNRDDFIGLRVVRRSHHQP